MADKHKLPYTAEEIERRLAGFGLQHFALTATTVDTGEAVDLAEEDRAALLSIIDPMVSSGKMLPIVAAIPADGIVLTTVLSAVANIAALDDWQITYGGNIWTDEVVLSVELIVNSAGMATIKVDTINISGADTEAIAADMEAILNAEY